MKFEYALIGVMAFLVAGILGLIAVSPSDIIEPRQEIQRANQGGVSLDRTIVESAIELAPESMEETEVMEEPIIEPDSAPTSDQEPQDLPEPEIQETTEAKPEVESMLSQEQMEAPDDTDDLPLMAEVSVGQGSSVPGCEQNNECYIPYSVEIGVSGEVIWSNDDAAAHTVTSGTVEVGPDGEFDSSLFLAGNTFSHTFETPGQYDYFCIVHPWMTGVIKVSE